VGKCEKLVFKEFLPKSLSIFFSIGSFDTIFQMTKDLKMSAFLVFFSPLFLIILRSSSILESYCVEWCLFNYSEWYQRQNL